MDIENPGGTFKGASLAPFEPPSPEPLLVARSCEGASGRSGFSGVAEARSVGAPPAGLAVGSEEPSLPVGPRASRSALLQAMLPAEAASATPRHHAEEAMPRGRCEVRRN